MPDVGEMSVNFELKWSNNPFSNLGFLWDSKRGSGYRNCVSTLFSNSGNLLILNSVQSVKNEIWSANSQGILLHLVSGNPD